MGQLFIGENRLEIAFESLELYRIKEPLPPVYLRTTWNLAACQTADYSAYHGMQLLGGGSKRRLKKCHFLTIQLIEASAAIGVSSAHIKYCVPLTRALLYLVRCRK